MEVPRVLGGRYELLEQLGSGGMAVVWLARDQVLDRTVAVKVLAARHAGDPGSREQMRHEARAAAALSHPNIAQVHDYGESEMDGLTIPYVVMEFVRGGTLQQHLEAGTVAPQAAMRLCAEVAAALAAAHADGLVHRDIKPANVMVTPAGAKVVDFGIAAIRQAGSGRRDAEIIGTPAYLAPERLANDAVDPACDVYAVGVLLYTLLSGRAPWTAETTTQMLNAHAYVEPDPLPTLPDVPEAVTELIHRCLRKDPARRPAAGEVAAVLADAIGLRVIGDEDTDATVVGLEPAVLVPGFQTGAMAAGAAGREPTEGVASPRRRRARVLLVAGAALVVALGLTGWFLTPTGSGTPTAQDVPAPTGTQASPRTPAPVTTRLTTPPPVTPGPAIEVRDGTRGQAGGLGAPTSASPAARPATPTTPPTASPAPTTTAAPPPPTIRRFTSAAGSVRATCSSPAVARLLSWRATTGYRVASVDPGPGAAPSVSFRHGRDEVIMTVTCNDGVPSETTFG